MVVGRYRRTHARQPNGSRSSRTNSTARARIPRLPGNTRAGNRSPTRIDSAPLVRLAVGIALSAVVAPVASVPALVRRELRVAVRADKSQVLATIVRRVSVDVVQDKCERQSLPRAGRAADRAAVRLSGGKVLPNVVALVAIDARCAGFQPLLCTCIAPGQRLTCITAVDLLTALREWRTAAETNSHGWKLRAGTDKRMPRGAPCQD